jgi:predicted Zn finger-like uncharacterized protein
MFRVTAEILRVADGQVRCGRCHTQFDALARLLEEGDPSAAESGRFLQTPNGLTPQFQPPRAEKIVLEGDRAQAESNEADEPAYAESEEDTDAAERWTDIDQDEETIDVTEVGATEVPPSASGTNAGETIEAEPEPRRPTRAPLGARLTQEPPASHDEDDDELSALVVRRRTSTSLVWKILVLPLALLLLAQVVHHYRAELARHPRLGAPLMDAYQKLGLQLTPEWDLHAYGIKQWGVVMDPSSPGTLIVRASITNNAPFAQPYPLLKLVLEDRWGDQVRAREFEPSEYLDPSIAPDRLLAPAQETNATISIVDPGPDAEGFRFDVCLRGRAGPVCAAEVPSAR